MEKFCKATARAKVNLSLDIEGVRDDMHVLESVTASVTLADEVDITFRSDAATDVRFLGADVPAENTVIKALAYLRTFLPDLGARVTVRKKIPLAGGLGGSSADAAAILVAATHCYPADLSAPQVYAGAVRIGSDVPSMCAGGITLLRGKGESVRRLPFVRLHLVLASGSEGVSTAKAYAEFDRLVPSRALRLCDTAAISAALACGDTDALLPHLSNALTDAACALQPQVGETLRALRAACARAAWMTGSGSCCCGLYASSSEAEAAAARLRAEGMTALAVQTSEQGVTIRS